MEKITKAQAILALRAIEQARADGKRVFRVLAKMQATGTNHRKE
jgi:hypothetical protein